MLKRLLWSPQAPALYGQPSGVAARRAAARALGAASLLLGRLAAQLSGVAVPRPTPTRPPVLEFYAEAGAPEGALYLDGELVGWLPEVKRL